MPQLPWAAASRPPTVRCCRSGRVRGGEWVAVHGCGGVGLSAVMIAAAVGARVVALDISEAALRRAREAGAELAVPAGTDIRELTDGGAHASLDAIGSEAACGASIAGLRKRGRHVQIGLLPEPPRVPMDLVIARELELLGSHGMAAHAYPEMLVLVPCPRTSGLKVHRLGRRSGVASRVRRVVGLGGGRCGG
jgi:D-arabinose 1-dehydrogenase-like Zn-dependent alcohol dehydrogenase